jgi:general secretion pathway protein G
MNIETGSQSASSLIPHPSSLAKNMQHTRKPQSGFTLIELLVVVTIVGILAGIAMVQVKYAQRKAQEAALRADLHEMRKAIDDYYADKQHYPTALDDLKPHYLRAIPKDPITKAADWQTVAADADSSGMEPTEAEKAQQDQQAQPGIVDVKSSAKGKTLDNVPYDQL